MPSLILTLRRLPILTFILCCTIGYGQEICDNAIDDDGDGMIDLNDDDCTCLVDPELILQGDFEDLTCCPEALTGGSFDGIECLSDGWGPGTTGGTSDFFHTCDYIGGGIIPTIPLPMPSGEGAVGIYSDNSYLETIGTCLNGQTLTAGTTYTLSFFMAAGDDGVFPTPLGQDYNLFGTASCANFPINTTDIQSPCMSNDPNWEVLTGFFASAVAFNSWTLIEVEFVPAFDVEAIALGHGCPSSVTYHFLDNIQIFETGVVEEALDISSSGDCLSGVTLEVDQAANVSYQWYLNGVAIVGETSNSYEVPNAGQEGNYQVVTTNNGNCAISPVFNVDIDEGVLEIDSDLTPIDCALTNNGGISITPLSDNTPFDYQWNTGDTESELNDLPEGDYSVIVTDANGCTGIEQFTLTAPPLVDVAVSGDCISGTLIAAANNILGPGATYQWYLDDEPIIGANNELYEIPSDAPGEYNLIIFNGEECRFSEPIQIDIDTEVLEVFGLASQITCAPDTVGVIEIVMNGVNAPYLYNWSNGASDQMLGNLQPGEYTVTVTDMNGCSGVETFEIFEIPDFQNVLNVIQADESTAASAEVISSGGSSPYTYEWSTGETSNAIDDIPPGNYSVTITDANGCIEVLEFEIESDFVVLEEFTDTVCFGACTGEIELTILDGVGEYTVEWTDSDLEGFVVSEVCAGSYAYLVSSESNATFFGNIQIVEWDSIGMDVVVLDTLCPPSDSTLIELSVFGGTSPYTYMWNDGSTDAELIVGETGSYDVVISDVNGCMFSQDFEVFSYDPILVDSEILPSGCNGEMIGSILLDVSGGTGPYTYMWSNDSTTNSIDSLGAGSYFVTVNDINGCRLLDSFLVSNLESIVINDTLVNNNCQDELSAFIEVTVEDGNPPYQYLWSTGDIVSNIYNLVDGDYSLTVSDDEGCTLERSYSITTNATLQVNAQLTQNPCFEDAIGEIDLSIDEAGGAFQILWSNGESTEDIQNLMAGDYSYELIDTFGCSYVQSFTITEGPEIAYNTMILEPNCNGATDGEIIVEVVSGNAPFTYIWSSGQQENALSGIGAGEYTVTIEDNIGCAVSETFTLMDNSDIEVVAEIIDVTCFGFSDGEIGLDIVGGTAPYIVNWSNGENTEDIQNLTFGTYAYTVVDATGCSKNEILTIAQPDELILDADQTDPLCAPELGEISISIMGGTAPYDILWSTGETGTSIFTSSGSNYEVSVTDFAQCSQILQFETPALDTLAIELIEVSNENVANQEGRIEVLAIGGTAPYSYLWSDGQMGLIAMNLSAGTYLVVVTDSNGCERTLSINLSPEELAAQSIVENNRCFGECEGSITLQVTGGIEPYTVEWSNGDVGLTLEDLCEGEYQATIRDSQGAEIQTPIFNIETESELETEDIRLNGDTFEVAEGSTVEVSLNSLDLVNISSIDWNTVNSLECLEELENGSCLSILLTVSTNETLEVIITDEQGCTKTLLADVVMIEPVVDIFIPNAFSPNEDGINDEFIISSNAEDVTINSFVIYDRWGNLVFRVSDVPLGQYVSWNGMFNANDAVPGVYVYQIEITVGTEPRLYAGDITLVR